MLIHLSKGVIIMSKKNITPEDYRLIEEIATRNNMSIKELAKYLTNKNGKYSMPQILLTAAERDLIDKRAAKINYSRSHYCFMCWKKAAKEKFYKDIDIAKLQERRYGDNSRNVVKIYFKNEEDYAELREVASMLGVSISALIRYVALNVEL